MGKVLLSCPKDKGFKAFKAWIREITNHFGVESTLDEKKLKAAWKNFWAKVEE